LGLNQPQPKRIGLFGGAFDPPHLAHRALAEAAIDQLQLDALHVLPTGDAWHKPRGLTASNHRLAMTQLAFADLAHAHVDPLELQRTGPSYTLDSLAALRSRFPQATFFIVMGADQAANFTTWHRWSQIVEWAQLAVADRPLEQQAGSAPHEWHNPELTRCVHLRLPLIPLSATDIRWRCARGLSLDDALSPAVIQYIQQNHLYTDQHDRSL
jgi:nicotinate-nucleotide adenylyltransferase